MVPRISMPYDTITQGGDKKPSDELQKLGFPTNWGKGVFAERCCPLLYYATFSTF